MHLLVIWLIVHAPAPKVSQNETTEITIVENEKSQTFVTETKDKPDVLDQLKDQATYLSQYTKRVKKEMKARRIDRTQNAGRPKTRQGSKVTRQEPGGTDIRLTPGGQASPQMAIGASSLAERIPGVDEGSFTALNTDQFTYYAFFSRMNEQIRGRWVNQVRSFVRGLSKAELENLSKKDRETVVEIILDERGHFMQSIVIHSSGSEVLDKTPVMAFKDASPFLNPPRGMIAEDGYIHLQYGFFIRFQPPSFGPAAN